MVIASSCVVIHDLDVPRRALSPLKTYSPTSSAPLGALALGSLPGQPHRLLVRTVAISDA